jgi:putative SbcD/Mre11-related phosphoesterase
MTDADDSRHDADGDSTVADPGPSGGIYRNRAVYFPAADALILADVHAGRDATSNVQLPMGERENLRERLAALIERFDPGEVVVGGDLLHAFDEVPRGVEETVLDLRDAARRRGTDLVVVRGNHDTMLDSVFSGETAGEYRLEDRETVVVHGHEPPETTRGVERYVIGHDHPTITIEGRRRACYLLGSGVHEPTSADVIVTPAFNRLCSGTVVNGADARDLLSPLVTNLDAFRPIVRDEDAGQTLEFPPLGRFRRLL